MAHHVLNIIDTSWPHGLVMDLGADIDLWVILSTPRIDAIENAQHLRDDLAAFRQLPKVWVAYPKALLVYGGSFLSPGAAMAKSPLAADRFQGEAAPAAGVPRMVKGDRWTRAEVVAWERQVSDYLLLLHRPDATDPEGAWREVAARPGSERLWQRSTMRLYHVRVPPGGAPRSG